MQSVERNRMRPRAAAALVALLAFGPAGAAGGGRRHADRPPVIPIGYDAYRMWDRWAYLRIGQRTSMTSTYDRRGGNEAADASHFLYQLADDRNVAIDVAGPGVIAFVRHNRWHGSPWHYIVDGRDYVVRETSTADPAHPVPGSVWLPEAAFPRPLAWTWSDTKGADLSWVPIPFARSFAMAYERTHYGTGYFIVHRFMPGADNLSRPIAPWSPERTPPADVLELLRRSGTDIAPHGEGVSVKEGTLRVPPKETALVARVTEAPSMIRALRFRAPEASAEAFSEAWLSITWDASPHPSVHAPIALLFGAGTIYNREGRPYLVKAFPVGIRFEPGWVQFAMYFPMPFLRSARIAVEEREGKAIEGVRWHLRYEPYEDPANWVAPFHATYADHGAPDPGRDLVFLDTREIEGGGDWCGHFVGTSFIFSDRAVLSTLEGDPRFYFDDSRTPQAQGTGTEEWGGGGDYWGGRTMTLPFAGHPVGCRSPKEARCEADLIQSAYRFLLADLMPFGRNARITFEHGGTNTSREHYRSITYWYGLHQPCLKRTDAFDVGDPEDEARHGYVSPTASPPRTLRSRFEWGIDHLGDRELHPEVEDTGRVMTGTSTFTVALDPENVGVLIRRTFDYAYPNPCARVAVADVRPDAPWVDAGIWYTAGSNTVVYSNPRGEHGPAQHVIQSSNRRWREDEFLIAPRWTRGRRAIRIRLTFVPRNIPLVPGAPLPVQAWSEYRYAVYCYVMPRV